MSNKLMLLYLDAPLQAWGRRSRHDFRDTFQCPTRSGVIGLLCAALGMKRDDRKGLGDLGNLVMHVYVLNPGEERLVDYHTVGGGYDKRDERERDFISRTAEGKVGSTVVTRREYLVGARFAVVLAGGAGLIERCAKAIQNPRWGIWLGRKSCPAASVIFRGVFDSFQEARKAIGLLKQGSDDGSGERLRVIREVSSLKESTSTVNDVPLDFAERRFTMRLIADGIEDDNADL